MARIVVVTLDGDLHAAVLKHVMAQQYGVDVAIVAADRIPAAGGLSWRSDDLAHGSVPTDDGGSVELADVDLVWWRRGRGEPVVPEQVTDPTMRKLVANDSRAGLRGIFLAAFDGCWLSDPQATERAQNKLLQLRVAREVGLSVPRTLVSSDPAAIRDFVRANGGRVVAKALTALLGTALEAGRVELAELSDDRELALAPTIYQAEVAGTDHLRVMVFGDQVYAARIRSAVLDWRLDGDVVVEPVPLDVRLQQQLRRVVDRLGLRMGIFDLKVTPAGQPVFLEINPQGQFLFVEGLCGMPLADAFARFVADELALVTV